MFYLIYSSYAVESFKEEEKFEALLIQSRENNARLEITGMLYYFNGSFIQLIEGGEKEVRGLYQRVSVDIRHKQPVIIKEGYNEKRFFPDWTMGYKKLTITTPEILADPKEFTEGIISVPSVLKLFKIAAEKP